MRCGNCNVALLQNISECYCCYELKGCEESIKSDLVLQDLAPVEKAVIPKLSRTKYGIDGDSWFFLVQCVVLNKIIWLEMLRAYHRIFRWLPLSTFQSYKIYLSLPSFLCLWTLIAVKRYRMEPYSILQASDITATTNNTSVRHICDQNRSNLPNVASEWCEIVRNTDCWVLEVTSQWLPDP